MCYKPSSLSLPVLQVGELHLSDPSCSRHACPGQAHQQASTPAGHIATTEQCLQRLVLGGIAVIVLVEAPIAEAAVHQQNLLNNQHLPEGVSIVLTQPRLLATCLRYMTLSAHKCCPCDVSLPKLILISPPYLAPRAAATQMSLDASLVAFVTLETRQAAAACRLAGLQLITTPQHTVSSVNQPVMQQSCCLTWMLSKNMYACARTGVNNATSTFLLHHAYIAQSLVCLL